MFYDWLHEQQKNGLKIILLNFSLSVRLTGEKRDRRIRYVARPLKTKVERSLETNIPARLRNETILSKIKEAIFESCSNRRRWKRVACARHGAIPSVEQVTADNHGSAQRRDRQRELNAVAGNNVERFVAVYPSAVRAMMMPSVGPIQSKANI